MTTLNNVRYSSILPAGKTGDYTEEQKVQFAILQRWGILMGNNHIAIWK